MLHRKTLSILCATAICLATLGSVSLAGRYDGLIEAWKAIGRNVEAPPPVRIDPPLRTTPRPVYTPPPARVDPPAPPVRHMDDAAQQRQAQHSWDARAEKEWKPRDINNQQELQRHLDNVRTNPNYSRDLTGNRITHGQVDPGHNTRGTIIIDNPNDLRNGGTAFTNENIFKRMDDLE